MSKSRFTPHPRCFLAEARRGEKARSGGAGFIILAALVFVLLSLFSCQNVKESRAEKEVQAQKAEVRQSASETETKVQPQHVKQSTGQLTEEEQKSFRGCMGTIGITQEVALKSLRILVKGDTETIRWYKEYEKSESRRVITDRRSLYRDDICSMVQVLSREKNKEGYSLILQVIEQKTEYPKVLACAVRAVKLYGELKDGRWYGDKRSIPVLKKIANDKDPEVRLEAAVALLSLGEGDIALPVLDELAKAGTQHSTAALNNLFAPEEKEIEGKKRIVLSDTKLFDERGKDILINALNYSSDEVKAFAAVRLAHMGIERKLVEDTAIKILERLKNKKKRDYKKLKEWQSARGAGYHAISALEKIKSTAGINVLNLLIENNDDPVLQKRAKSALENIQQK